MDKLTTKLPDPPDLLSQGLVEQADLELCR
jgi:hypothetical protein